MDHYARFFPRERDLKKQYFVFNVLIFHTGIHFSFKITIRPTEQIDRGLKYPRFSSRVKHSSLIAFCTWHKSSLWLPKYFIYFTFYKVASVQWLKFESSANKKEIKGTTKLRNRVRPWAHRHELSWIPNRNFVVVEMKNLYNGSYKSYCSKLSANW